MPTNYDIGGKVIALTGGASGIGLQTALLLSAQGAHLSIADVNEKPLAEITEKLSSSGGKVLSTQLDVRDDKAVDAWIEKTVEHFGQLDGAVNLAGRSLLLVQLLFKRLTGSLTRQFHRDM